MARQEKYVVILPYYCEEEVTRYLRIAEWLQRNCSTPLPVHFLLAASPRTQHSRDLFEAYSQIGECTAFQCPSQIFGYPEGPSAMFWDAMDFIAEKFADYQGFSLWLESDMSFTQPDWLPRLVHEWNSNNDTPPLVMGCYVPEVYKSRLFKKRKLLLTDHINGGACYSLDFANRMPEESREGVFDMSVHKFGKEVGGVKKTRQICFSSVSRVRRDLMDTGKVVLHGFMQEKDEFIEECVRPLTESEKKSSNWNPLKDKYERMRRRIRVWFVRRGHRAMLENMLLAKHKFESTEPLQTGVSGSAKKAA